MQKSREKFSQHHRDIYISFIYIFRALAIMTLHSILSFVALVNTYLLGVHPSRVSAIHLHKIFVQVVHSLPSRLFFIMS